MLCNKCQRDAPDSEFENTSLYGIHLRHKRELCRKEKNPKVRAQTPKRERRDIQLFEYETVTRPAVFARAKGRCEESGVDLAPCGAAGTVPHHIHGRIGTFLVDEKNIIVLCDYHHKEAHRHLKESRERHDEIRRMKP